MKIIFTKHAEEKFKILSGLGWKITKAQIKKVIRNPRWRGTSQFGQETALDLLDQKHILRVILNREDDIITVVTFHPARRGTYESKL